jgi:hypothetical protein
MKATRFLYRVTVTNSQGRTGTFVAEATANLDETARRKIVAIELKAGNQVRSIVSTSDRAKKNGDWAKRSYKD